MKKKLLNNSMNNISCESLGDDLLWFFKNNSQFENKIKNKIIPNKSLNIDYDVHEEDMGNAVIWIADKYFLDFDKLKKELRFHLYFRDSVVVLLWENLKKIFGAEYNRDYFEELKPFYLSTFFDAIIKSKRIE